MTWTISWLNLNQSIKFQSEKGRQDKCLKNIKVKVFLEGLLQYIKSGLFEHVPPNDIGEISATSIRAKMRKDGQL